MESIIMLNAEDLRNIVREEVEAAVKKVEKRNDLPAVLSRKDVMDLLQIGHSKAAELFGRPDFPVCRELGGVKVRTEKLFDWMDKHTQWVESETSYFPSAI